jgi:hypothetical protein
MVATTPVERVAEGVDGAAAAAGAWTGRLEEMEERLARLRGVLAKMTAEETVQTAGAV